MALASAVSTTPTVEDEDHDPVTAIPGLLQDDKDEPYVRTHVFSFHELPWACSIAQQTTAKLQVWVGVQAIEHIHLKQTANFHWKQSRLHFHVSVSFGWVQTQP